VSKLDFLPFLISCLFLASCGSSSSNPPSNNKENRGGKEAAARVYGNETSSRDPLYKDIDEYVCQYGDNDLAYMVAFNNVTGVEYTRVFSRLGVGKRVKYDPNIHDRLNEGVRIEFMQELKDGDYFGQKKYFKDGEYKGGFNYAFNPKMNTVTFSFFDSSGSSSGEDEVQQCSYMGLPFAPDPDAFMHHLNNNLNWGRGRELTFSSLDSCREEARSSNPNKVDNRPPAPFIDREYSCNYGFVRISTPLGVENCELSDVSYEVGYSAYLKRFISRKPFSYSTSRCAPMS